MRSATVFQCLQGSGRTPNVCWVDYRAGKCAVDSVSAGDDLHLRSVRDADAERHYEALWPFLSHGLEQEFIDAPYYYTGAGQFYSPQLVRSLSQVGQTSSSGPGPSGNSIGRPSGGGGESFGKWLAGDVEGNAESFAGFNYNSSPSDLPGDVIDLTPALPIIIKGIEDLVSFFDLPFGGGSSPPLPRQLHHGRHPLYDSILGIQGGGLAPKIALPSSIDSIQSR